MKLGLTLLSFLAYALLTSCHPPVRRALEIQYAKLEEAVENKDFEAFQALRTDDFSTVDAEGRRQNAEQMATRARGLLDRIQPPIQTTITIQAIEVNGDEATATVRQFFSRMQDMAGQQRKMETYVTQEETWRKTPDGWKLTFVDGVRDMERYVDGVRTDPSKPYDPDAPPYVPDSTGVSDSTDRN